MSERQLRWSVIGLAWLLVLGYFVYVLAYIGHLDYIEFWR